MLSWRIKLASGSCLAINNVIDNVIDSAIDNVIDNAIDNVIDNVEWNYDRQSFQPISPAKASDSSESRIAKEPVTGRFAYRVNV